MTSTAGSRPPWSLGRVAGDAPVAAPRATGPNRATSTGSDIAAVVNTARRNLAGRVIVRSCGRRGEVRRNADRVCTRIERAWRGAAGGEGRLQGREWRAVSYPGLAPADGLARP